mgnify:CR=1 FL=1
MLFRSKYRPTPPEVQFRKWIAFREPLSPMVALIPDGYLEIEVAGNVRPMFLEVDLGTEDQTVWRKKLQLYLQLPFPFYGTLASIVFASWIRYLPYGMRYSFAGILQVHTDLEQASAVSGARQFTTFVRIVMPLVAPALTTCWLFVFLLSVGAVSLPIRHLLLRQSCRRRLFGLFSLRIRCLLVLDGLLSRPLRDLLLLFLREEPDKRQDQ